MREIVLDTETTGLDPDEGHRIVEVGAIELLNHLPTGRSFHCYLNPERAMPAEAFAIHGLGDAFLADKPRFAEIAQEFLDFIADARLVIHNAAFDLRFLNAELERHGHRRLEGVAVVDTLAVARQRFPGAQHSLDALCRRFGIDASARTLHGALLDSQILAEVYLELVGGRQPQLLAIPDPSPAAASTARPSAPGPRQAGAARRRPVPLAPRLTPAEAEAHRAFVDAMGQAALWRRFD
jgi:DNA polymerase-3 subunit epsilon